MKLNMTALLLMVACGTAAAQAPDTPSRVKALLAGSAAGSAGAPVHTAGSPLASPSVKPVSAEVKPANGAVEISAHPGDALPLHPHSAAGRRDPFVSPVVDRGPAGGGCAAGKRCLVIDQVVLRGIVRTPTGLIAVVANSANKAYFLREKDPVFNGMVVKITPDSVVFKESTVDNAGRTNTREVVKKVSPTPSV
jgi:hypothetical protein